MQKNAIVITSGMADDAPLVDFEEVPDVSYAPRQTVPSLPLKDEQVTSGGNFSLLLDAGEISNGQETSVPDLICAVFVVQFDTRRGWSFHFHLLYSFR